MFLRAKSFNPRKVVRFFNSSNGMISNSFAKHSSAKEFDTTSTPSKSSTTFSSPCIIGSNILRTFSPNILVPRFSPIVTNLNVTMIFFNTLAVKNLYDRQCSAISKYPCTISVQRYTFPLISTGRTMKIAIGNAQVKNYTYEFYMPYLPATYLLRTSFGTGSVMLCRHRAKKDRQEYGQGKA